MGRISIIAFLFLSACSVFIPEKSKEVKLPQMLIQTEFPTDTVDDYQPNGYLAKVAPSKDEREHKVWLKGSARYPQVIVEDETINLKPPFYTSTFHTQTDSLKLVFQDTLGKTTDTWVYRSKSEASADSFSIMAYGCFQPFQVDDKSGIASIRTQNNNKEYRFRQVFADIALGRKKVGSTDSTDGQSVLPAVQAIIATGDQVYTDPAYHTESEINPISAWSVGDRPLPMLNETSFIEHLHRTYLAFGSFSTLSEVNRHLPTYPVWDDHEIRDGWGSQGDEYLGKTAHKDSLNPRFANYFKAARKAFVEHQLSPVLGEDTIRQLYYHQNINGIPAFFMDLRSDRNILGNQVIDDAQFDSLRIWLENLEDSSTAIIVNSIPLFWRAPGTLQLFARLSSQSMDDDIADSWGSREFQQQRNELFRLLLSHRMNSHLRYIIISGDVHLGAINEVWFEEEEEEVKSILAYEMIISGFSHDDLSEHGWGARLSEIVNSKNEICEGLTLENRELEYNIKMHIRAAAAQLNFGALAKEGKDLSLNLFLKINQAVKQITLPLDFEKTYDEDKYKEIEDGSGATVLNKKAATQITVKTIN